jgi:hypothetical protein
MSEATSGASGNIPQSHQKDIQYMTHSMHGGGHEVKNKMLSTEVSGFFLSQCAAGALKKI